MTGNSDEYNKLSNYFSYRDTKPYQKIDKQDLEKLSLLKPNVISIIYNKDNTEILNKVLNITPDSIIIFYGNLGEKKDLYNNYDVCIYSSIVATKLDSNKIINHYSDIIEEEINSEENNEDNKIYVLTPK